MKISSMKKRDIMFGAGLLSWPKASKFSNSIIPCSGLVFLITFALALDGAAGQVKGSKVVGVNPSACECVGVPCERNITVSDCPNGRIIAREDCKCCFVCAKQLTEKCNNRDMPCDSDFGLVCGPDSKCQAGNPCSDDTSCGSNGFCISGACANPCSIHPDVCKNGGLKNGVCLVRNHRAMCSCPEGLLLDSAENECVERVKDVFCIHEDKKVAIGSKVYTDKCTKECKCKDGGEFSCKELRSEPECKPGMIPMTRITGEMNAVCKLLTGKSDFDGCCVPQKCQNATAPEDSKGSRGFKLSESQNNLEDEEEKPKAREMLLKSNDDEEVSSSNEKMEEAVEDMTTMKSAEIEAAEEPKPIKEGATKKTSKDKSEKKVSVMKRTAHTAVVSVPTMTDEVADLSIAVTSELESMPESSFVWKMHMIPAGLGQVTLTDLLPNTSYTLKYSYAEKQFPLVQFITEEDTAPAISTLELTTSKPMEDASNMSDSEATTMPSGLPESDPTDAIPASMDDAAKDTKKEEKSESKGMKESIKCSHNGTMYAVGEVALTQGCGERCECMKNGEMECIERCSIPFFKKGHFAHDPMCFEEPSGVDDCCVIVACARSANVNSNGGAGEARVLKLNPCDGARCGPNSECRYEVSPSGMQNEQENQETLCVCKDGFVGNPNDEKVGCSPVATTSSAPVISSSSSKSVMDASSKPEGCKFNNKTYEFGQEDYDGCSYKCRCETSGEFLCRPRCNFQRDEEKDIPKGCEIKKDVSDPECCEMLSCPGQTTDNLSSKKESPVNSADGCVYKNKTYSYDTKFYDGCESQCMCFSNGDVTCQARCPPAGPNANEDCITLPDPIDKCCTVTVCDPKEKQSIADVMKAANETDPTILPALMPEARLILGDNETLASTTTASSSSSSTTTPPAPTSTSSISPIVREEEEDSSSSAEDTREKLPTMPISPGASVARITSIAPINDTSVMVTISVPEKELALLDDQMIKIYYSMDMETWSELELRIKDLYVEGRGEIHTVINGLLPMREYYFKALVNGTETQIFGGHTQTMMGSSEEYGMSSHELLSGEMMPVSGEEVMCKYKGQMFHVDQEFFDKCDAYCMCEEGGSTKCVPIQCPEDLGLEVLDPDCLKWEPAIPNFERKPPVCCQEMRCVQNATCTHPSGYVFKNYEELPKKLTGCDKECFCQNGNITCENVCSPVPELPPSDLRCPPEMAMLVPIPPSNCCHAWVCRNPGNRTDGSVSHLPNPTTLTDPDSRNITAIANNNGTQFNYNHPGHDDQFVPPSTGNQPSFVPLNKINRQQLQELLHQLSQAGADGHGHHHPEDEYEPVVPQGTYVSVKDPSQLVELEKAGAKIVEQVADGSFVVFIPAPEPIDHIPHRHHPHAPVLPGHPGAPPGFPFGPQFGGLPHRPASTEQLQEIQIQALNESTLQIDFIVAPILVGLNGHVIVLYTKDFDSRPNPDQWERQEFQQKEQIIDNAHMQLFLLGLEPETDYHLQIQVVLRDIQNRPSSQIYLVRTPPPAVPATTLPPEIEIDPEVKLLDVSSNTVKLTWRKFSDFESSLIDGVQIKYKAELDQVYSTTPLIHRSITSYELTNLQQGQSYEIDLLFIPFTNQSTELRSHKPIHIKTLPEEDAYAFTIAVETGKVTESSAELIIHGVPYPEDKYVNIYQVNYQSDLEKEQKSFFKVAKRDSSKNSAITYLKPGTRYRVWVEAFLTNGKKRRTNVIDVLTKAGELPQPDRASQDQLLEDARSKENMPEPASYSGALVALAIVAALAILGIIVLLMILIKKQSQAKAPISDRKSESSYDNPSFKNYDLEANGHSKPGDA